MNDLARKLGLKPGQVILLLEASPDGEGRVKKASPPGVIYSATLEEKPFDQILFWPRQLQGLLERFALLQDCIRPEGAIWAILPKKKFAQARGIDFTWEQMQEAGLQTDLVDNKTASFSQEEYATRFVIRKARRKPA
jgi:hypothetical protein